MDDQCNGSDSDETLYFVLSGHMPQSQVRHIGFCIYCGSREKLTDEHVLPYGLGGTSILYKASCKNCNRITASIEDFALRKMFLEVRTQYQLPTRRPKERPKTFPAYMKTGNGIEEWTDLPIDRNPAFLCLPNFSYAPILAGESWHGWFPQGRPPFFWTCVTVENEKQAASRQALLAKKAYINYPHGFALFLAKVAYCSAIWSLGIEAFEPLIRDLILTRSRLISDYVGFCQQPVSINREVGFHFVTRTLASYVVVDICIFASLGAPIYQVVVGKPKVI